jgi:hypothetical protein
MISAAGITGDGTKRAVPVYRRRSNAGETPMKAVKTILAGSMLVAISSIALAQQALTGTVTTINRINGTIAIRQTQSGTVGANNGGAVEQFNAQANLLNEVHAGDRVTYTVGETGPTKTITKIEKQ